MVTASGLKTNMKVFFLLSLLTGIFVGAGYFLGGTGGMFIGLLLAGGINFASYWYSDKIVLKMYGARELEEGKYPELHASLEELSRNANIPKPDLYLSDMEMPNAFATGRSPNKGVVCLTQGLLDSLEQDEIEGVIAHELAHIRNRDTLVNTVTATIAGALGFMAELLFWGSLFSGREEDGEAFAAIAFMILTPLIALIIRTAISRSMEFRADSHGVRIHGQKAGLKSALQKINSYSPERRPRHSAKYEETGANLFIENPFRHDSITRFFATHPPLDKRVKNIDSTEL